MPPRKFLVISSPPRKFLALWNSETKIKLYFNRWLKYLKQINICAAIENIKFWPLLNWIRKKIEKTEDSFFSISEVSENLENQ